MDFRKDLLCVSQDPPFAVWLYWNHAWRPQNMWGSLLLLLQKGFVGGKVERKNLWGKFSVKSLMMKAHLSEQPHAHLFFRGCPRSPSAKSLTLEEGRGYSVLICLFPWFTHSGTNSIINAGRRQPLDL